MRYERPTVTCDRRPATVIHRLLPNESNGIGVPKVSEHACENPFHGWPWQSRFNVATTLRCLCDNRLRHWPANLPPRYRQCDSHSSF